jgi:hypothetical protein
VADQAAIGPADQAARSLLDQAAADNSITQARTRAVDPVPIVAEPVIGPVIGPVVAGSATLEPVLETNESDMGVNTSVNPEAVDGSTAAAPVAGARRRLSPRPVPVSRRRRPAAPATEVTAVATDEERTPAEEMDDVGTKDEKAELKAEKAATTPAAEAEAGASSSGTTATKTARPKTAAEIVAEQRARERAATEVPATDAAGSEDAAPDRQDEAPKDAAAKEPAAAAAGAGAVASKPAAKPTGASGNKPAAAKSGSGVGKQALTSVGSGVRKLRNLIASLVWLVAVLAAAVLALGALFTALDQTNQSNEIVRWILERGHDLVGPFKDLFRLETAKNTLLVNWGIAALVYLIAGKIVEKIIRP